MDRFVRAVKPRPKDLLPSHRPASGKQDADKTADRVERKDHASVPLSELPLEELENELRLFDLDPKYGPFVGIQRMERWERAARLGLDPPERVREILRLERQGIVNERDGGHLW